MKISHIDDLKKRYGFSDLSENGIFQVHNNDKKFLENFKQKLIAENIVEISDIIPSVYGLKLVGRLKESVNDLIAESADIDESVEVHDTLNPKLWNNDNTLKEDVRSKILEIADDFINDLKDDEVKINVVDIKLVGSNCSYNYNDASDLDIHIEADTDSLSCPDNLYPLLYSAYRSIWNSKYNPTLNGIPVELFVETSDTQQPEVSAVTEARTTSALNSNGIYSVLNNKWIREPKKESIPAFDETAFNELFEPWEERYFDLKKDPSLDAVDKYINDIYELRKSSIAQDGEYGLGNLVFKECRALGYLDDLKQLKNDLKSDQLSLK